MERNRIIPETPPRLEEMNLPPGVRALADSRRGVILVSGPARSGKSTTLAAIIDYINRTRPGTSWRSRTRWNTRWSLRNAKSPARTGPRTPCPLTVALQAALREDRM
jgi:twitching motility protein PilT